MKRRIATSNKIADLKKRLRNSAELEYQTLLHKRQELLASLHVKLEELQDSENRLKANAIHLVHVTELKAWSEFIEVCRSQIKQLEEEIQQFEVVCEGKRQFLVERYVDEKKWLQYKEHLSEVFTKRLVFEEQKQLDEIAVQRSSRLLV